MHTIILSILANFILKPHMISYMYFFFFYNYLSKTCSLSTLLVDLVIFSSTNLFITLIDPYINIRPFEKIIIQDGNLKATDIPLNDVLIKLNGENISDIKLCTMNKTGQLHIIADKVKMPLGIIVNGQIKFKNLKYAGKDIYWLNKTLKHKMLVLEEIKYAFFLNNQLYFIK